MVRARFPPLWLDISLRRIPGLKINELVLLKQDFVKVDTKAASWTSAYILQTGNQREIRVCLRRGGCFPLRWFNVWHVTAPSATNFVHTSGEDQCNLIDYSFCLFQGSRRSNPKLRVALSFDLPPSHDISFIDTGEQLDFCGEKKGNDWFGRGKIIASSVVRTIVCTCV